MADINKSIDTSKVSGVVLLLLIIIGGGVYWNYQNNETEKTSIYAPVQEVINTINPNIPDTTAGLIVVSTNETAESSIKYIYAEVKNTGQRKTGVSLTATLYDEDGKVIGTELGAVENIETGETKTATFYITQPTEQFYSTYKIDINGAY